MGPLSATLRPAHGRSGVLGHPVPLRPREPDPVTFVGVV